MIARKRLAGMLDELDRSIAILQGNRDDGSGSVPDPADSGANLSEADRTEAVLDSARRQREQVAAALQRMVDGGYGRCVDCGKDVPEGRLEARPEAARCVSCQSKRDRTRR